MFKRRVDYSKLINNRTFTLVSGLALAAAGAIGASDVLVDASATDAPPERLQVDVAIEFGTTADAVYATQGLSIGPMFGITADAVYAVEGIVFNQP
jgi:hypothetical protein